MTIRRTARFGWSISIAAAALILTCAREKNSLTGPDRAREPDAIEVSAAPPPQFTIPPRGTPFPFPGHPTHPAHPTHPPHPVHGTLTDTPAAASPTPTITATRTATRTPTFIIGTAPPRPR